MLQRNQRYVLYFDLAMAPFPSDAPAIDLAELMPLLKVRCEAQETVEVIDNDRRIVRLLSMSEVKLANEEPAMAMLFCLGDKEKADPGVTNVKTGEVRVFEKKEDEVGGLSVHAVVSMRPTKKGGHLYRMVMEDVTGFGRTIVQSFLRSQFRDICDDQDYTFKRDDKRPVKTRPLVTLNGHASQQLKESLSQGKLLQIELVNYIDEDFGFDEQKFIKETRQNMSLAISRKLPEGEALSIVEKVKVWAKARGYDNMRIRWKDPSTSKPQSAKIDTAKQDAGEAFFIRTAEVKFQTPLSDITDKMSMELINEMKKLLVE